MMLQNIAPISGIYKDIPQRESANILAEGKFPPEIFACIGDGENYRKYLLVNPDNMKSPVISHLRPRASFHKHARIYYLREISSSHRQEISFFQFQHKTQMEFYELHQTAKESFKTLKTYWLDSQYDYLRFQGEPSESYLSVRADMLGSSVNFTIKNGVMTFFESKEKKPSRLK